MKAPTDSELFIGGVGRFVLVVAELAPEAMPRALDFVATRECDERKSVLTWEATLLREFAEPATLPSRSVKRIRRRALAGAERRKDWPSDMHRDFVGHIERKLVAGAEVPARTTPRACRCAAAAVRELETTGQALALLEDAIGDLELAAGFLFKAGTTREHRRLMQWLARFAYVAEHAATSFDTNAIRDQARIADSLTAMVKPLERARKKQLGSHAPSYGWSVVKARRPIPSDARQGALLRAE